MTRKTTTASASATTTTNGGGGGIEMTSISMDNDFVHDDNDNDDDDDVDNEFSKSLPRRTEIPNDRSHIQTLVSHSFRKDTKKCRLYATKLFLLPGLLMLYTLSSFLAGLEIELEKMDDENMNGFKLHHAEYLAYPKKILIGGNDDELVSDVVKGLYHVKDESYYFATFSVAVVDTNATTNFDNMKIDTDSYTEDELFMIQFKYQCEKDIIDASDGGDHGGGSVGGEVHPYARVCVYLQSSDAYTIYYDGEYIEWVTSTLPPLAATQDLINRAMLYHAFSSYSDAKNLNTNNDDDDKNNESSKQSFDEKLLPMNPVLYTQQVPEKIKSKGDIKNDDDDDKTHDPGLLVPGIMHVLSFAACLQFITGPITFDVVNHVTRSYLSVGVKLTSYLLHWIVYAALLNGGVTCIILSLVSVFWKLYPQSDILLIFISHWLGYIATVSKFVLILQFIKQEEMAKGVPLMISAFSMSVGAAASTIFSVKSIEVTVLSVVFPFVGIIQYYGIYTLYDYTGYDTGIHLLDGNNTFVESGLLHNMIGQIFSIIFWMFLIFLYANPELRPWHQRRQNNALRRNKQSTNHNNDNVESDMTPLIHDASEGGSDGTVIVNEEDTTNNNNNNGDKNDSNKSDAFEPRPPGSEVVVSVRGLEHVYPPEFSWFGSFGSNKKKKKRKPVEVLKGLDMDICRGEVFGYLGHNGAGKTTSINILSGETKLQQGDVTFRFRTNGGDNKTIHQSLQTSTDVTKIQTRIGVCPQENTMLQDDMTARETLRLFANLKGGMTKRSDSQSVKDAIEEEINRRLDEIKFTSEEDADKPLETFSGGMKRKLLIAVALLGDPEVVFLDEPTAGLDPYNRRTIWDMIIAAKRGRSIILTTHFLDEADVLSDRIGIIKNGKLITCGSSLFLKHHFGAGYELNYNTTTGPSSIDIPSIIPNAIEVPNHIPDTYKWRLDHGTEPKFPDLLSKLGEMGATNVSLELTTLEQVFLKTGKEDKDENDDDENDDDDVDESNDKDDDGAEEGEADDDEAADDIKAELLSKIWKPRGTQKLPSLWTKFYLVQHFMMTNAWKMKGAVSSNIIMPMVYLVLGVMVASSNEIADKEEFIFFDPIHLDPHLVGGVHRETYRFFGASSDLSFPPFQFTKEPNSLDYFLPSSTEEPPVIGGYYARNTTLQHAPDVTPFALQLSFQLLANATAVMQGQTLSSSSEMSASLPSGISASIQPFPYISSESWFRLDVLILPYCLTFGFPGIALTVLDIVSLKADKLIALFGVAGISEWMTYLGVASYKTTTTFVPAVLVLVVLGLNVKLVLFGNAGRWLATFLVLIGFAYSTLPMVLILAKRFIHGDYKSVAGWYPGTYFSLVGLPYMFWATSFLIANIATDASDAVMSFGDMLCIFPPFAFQRGLAAIIFLSNKYEDEDLSWNDVWRFEARVGLPIMMMFGIGTLEWAYLRSLTKGRELKTKLSTVEKETVGTPVDINHDEYMVEERKRSYADDDGINARDLVKVFRIPPSKDSKAKVPIIKQAIKGVSFGIRKNEIFALLGPNGAGKTTAMHVLAGHLTPEYGAIALDGRTATDTTRSVDYLYDRCKISYCPQFDALFKQKTVEEHLKFYSAVRGLDLKGEYAKDHVKAIVELLGLEKHRDKKANDLSGGYKRRLSLAVAMVGYPHVMMVDECTTGLDPGARRKIWNVLKPEVPNRGQYDIPAILLSSHYMDECQELGTRIGIMIDGEIASTGTLAQLQDRYCTSFFVEIAFVTSTDEEIAKARVTEAFQQSGSEANIYESLPYHCKLQIPFLGQDRSIGNSGSDNTNQLGQIFHLLESNKKEFGIKFYSVSKMNLEQIFIDLSRKQFEADLDFNATPPTSPSIT